MAASYAIRGPERPVRDQMFDKYVEFTIFTSMTDLPELKPVVWMGTSRRAFRDMPAEVKSHLGYAIYVAQQGSRHRDAKPLKGFGGASVLEVVKDHRGDTFRAVYTVRIAEAIYVLHAFQKKSKSGSKTPKTDMALIEARLQAVLRMAKGEGR